MNTDFPKFIVTFYSQKTGSIAGTGFFASKKYLVTCAHVVNVVLGKEKRCQEKPDQDAIEVSVYYNGKKERVSANIIRWIPPLPIDADPSVDGCYDLAYLEIDNNHSVDNIQLIEFSDDKCIETQPFLTFGFRYDWPNGRNAIGTIHSKNVKGLFELRGDSEDLIFVETGFSGGPVIVNGSIVGMICSIAKKKIAYMIPSSAICSCSGNIELPLKSSLSKTYSHIDRVYDMAIKALIDAGIQRSFDVRAKFFDCYYDIIESWDNPIAENYDQTALRPIDILKINSDNKRCIHIQAPGGFGKSAFLAQIIIQSLSEGFVPFFLNFSRRCKEDLSEQEYEKRGKSIFNYFSVSGDFDKLKEVTSSHGEDKTIICVDSLNESDIDIEMVLEAFRFLAITKYPKIKLILAERMKDRGQLEDFVLLSMLPLPQNEIANNVTRKKNSDR